MNKVKSSIIEAAQKYAVEVLENELPETIKYHSVEHTKDVVKAAIEIANHSHITEEELEIIELAAWFHDLGYTKSLDNHEERSVEMANEFLLKQGVDDSKVTQVADCIMATKMPQNPKNILGAILCDADLVHLSKDNYCEKADLLHDELEQLFGKEITDKEWYLKNQQFIANHHFFTDFARNAYAKKVDRNLEIVKEKISQMKKHDEEVHYLESKVKKLKKKVKEAKEVKPTRGIETMFRLTSKNHLDLSSMADTKANIMISVNSIILSVIVSVLIRKLDELPHLIIPTAIMTLVCLATIVFAILATRPNVSKGTFTDQDIQNKKTNLLFFGNFHQMKMDKYEWAMKEMMSDGNYLYSSLIRDIYLLGVVLGKKYKLLRISYTIFMFGFVVSVIAFMLAEIFLKTPAMY